MHASTNYRNSQHEKESSKYVTNLQECPHSGWASYTQSRANQEPSILTLHTLNLECALRCDMEMPIRIAWEHEDLAAFLGPEHRRGWVACCNTLKTRQAIQTHFLVLRFCRECGCSCNRRRDQHLLTLQMLSVFNGLGMFENVFINKLFMSINTSTEGLQVLEVITHNLEQWNCFPFLLGYDTVLL